MKKAVFNVSYFHEKGRIDRRLFGSFVEHLGRSVYGGIYEKEHISSDENGFRKDVIELVKELGPTIIRYPGGNFVSQYNWQDGVGPLESRPNRIEKAWRSIETNEFGTNEFLTWSKKVECDVMMAVNLGTGTPKEAADLVEYCNVEKDTYFSDMRIEHGYEKTHDIKLWCLGNEMDGKWQIGSKTAKDYGKIAYESAKQMKRLDDSIEVIACGSSAPHMSTFAIWEEEVLSKGYEIFDYISMHNYFNPWSEETKDFTSSLEDYIGTVELTNRAIDTIASVCDYVKRKVKSNKEMYISFDEWNVWFHSSKNDKDVKPWQKAPSLLEDIYTFEDGLVVSAMLMTLLKKSSRVKIACLAQLVNVIAPIYTKTGGRAIKQSIFYPFYLVSKYAKGRVLDGALNVEKYQAKNVGTIDCVDCVLTQKENEDMALFILNRTENDIFELEVDFYGFEYEMEIKKHYVFNHKDLKSKNTFKEPDTIVLHENGESGIKNRKLTANIPAHSFHCVVINKI